jgi:hypothetical protein
MSDEIYKEMGGTLDKKNPNELGLYNTNPYMNRIARLQQTLERIAGWQRGGSPTQGLASCIDMARAELGWSRINKGEGIIPAIIDVSLSLGDCSDAVRMAFGRSQTYAELCDASKQISRLLDQLAQTREAAWMENLERVLGLGAKQEQACKKDARP